MIDNPSISNSQTPPIPSKYYIYTRKGLWTLFLMCAFPLHVWTIILGFNDISWVSERTDMWDAIGVISYGLVFTFIESLIIFLLIAGLGFLISKAWDENRRVAILSALIIILSIWGMINHSYFLWGLPIPIKTIATLAGTDHPLRIIYSLVIVPVYISLLAPTYLILKSDKFFKFVISFIDGLSLLMAAYLFLDLIGLIIVILRNF